LNLTWKSASFTRKELLNRGYVVGPLTFGMENCILIDGRPQLTHYHTPEFGFSYGVVGCTLDGLHYVVAIKSETLSEAVLTEIIKNFPLIKVYGGKNFKRDFYPASKVPKEILRQIKMSNEENVQFDITLENPWDQFRESSKEFLAIIEKVVEKLHAYKITAINPLQATKYRGKSQPKNTLAMS